MRLRVSQLLLVGVFSLANIGSAQPQVITSNTPALSTTTSRTPQTTTVNVGKADHVFEPAVVLAEVGDYIKFQFYPTNHSVVRAEYLHPCVPYENFGPGRAGFSSGFKPVDAILPDPPSWTVRVNDTDPIFYYCSAPGSCISRQMVGVINPNKTTSLALQSDQARKSKFMLQPGEPLPGEDVPSPTSSTGAVTSSTTGLSNAASSSSSTSTSVTTATHSSTSHGLSTGAIVGIAVGGVAVLALLAALFFFIGRAKTLKQQVQHQNNAMPTTPAMYQNGSTIFVPVRSPHLSTVYDASGHLKHPDAGIDELGSMRSTSLRADHETAGFYDNERSGRVGSASPSHRFRQSQTPQELYAPMGPHIMGRES